MGNTTITNSDQEHIVTTYKSGLYTQKQLADMHHTSQQSINHTLKCHGLVAPRSNPELCYACGRYKTHQHFYTPVCYNTTCLQAYHESLLCNPHDPLYILRVQQHCHFELRQTMEIHTKRGVIDTPDRYVVFNSAADHIKYHRQKLDGIPRHLRVQPIWDGTTGKEGKI